EGLELQQRLEVTREDLLFLLSAQRREPLHPRDRRGVPRHEGPVAAEHHAVGAHLVEQEPQRLLAPDNGVVVETTLVTARRARNRALLGPHALPAAVDAP